MPCLTGRDQLQSVAVRPPQTRVQRRRHTVQHCTYVMIVCRRAALARGCGRGLHVVRFIKKLLPIFIIIQVPAPSMPWTRRLCAHAKSGHMWMSTGAFKFVRTMW